MARPIKSGIDYFPMDTDFFTDRKIIVLMNKRGKDGVMVYLYMLMHIYREQGYYLEPDDLFFEIAANDLRIEKNRIFDIIDVLFELKLFDNCVYEDTGCFTSRGVQRRYQLAVEQRLRKRKIIVRSDVWILPDEEMRVNMVFDDGSECRGDSFDGVSPCENP